jgi:hypothetical protein
MFKEGVCFVKKCLKISKKIVCFRVIFFRVL